MRQSVLSTGSFSLHFTRTAEDLDPFIFGKTRESGRFQKDTIMPTPSSSASLSPLWTLPRELRDMVYGYILSTERQNCIVVRPREIGQIKSGEQVSQTTLTLAGGQTTWTDICDCYLGMSTRGDLIDWVEADEETWSHSIVWTYDIGFEIRQSMGDVRAFSRDWAFLRTCRQAYGEGTDMLYGHYLFSFPPDETVNGTSVWSFLRVFLKHSLAMDQRSPSKISRRYAFLSEVSVMNYACFAKLQVTSWH